MADLASQTTAASAPDSPTKKEKKTKNASPRTKPSHPPTSEMVNNAIKGLKERGGSSLQAIKKYVAANYKVDAEKVAPFIKKYLKSAVASGSLVQTKGKGASGSFKLANATSAVSTEKGAAAKSKKVPLKKTTAAAKSAKKATVSKTAKTQAEKKAASTPVKAKKPAAEKKVAKAKTPSKVKKSNKSPTKKPKAPKPKTAKAVTTSTKAKKAASPKRKK